MRRTYLTISSVLISFAISGVAQANPNHHNGYHAKRVPHKVIKHKWKEPRYRIGYIRKDLPSASIAIRVGNISFRYNSGIFYRPSKHGYKVVKAPIGARVKILPSGYRRLLIGSRVYFVLNDTYYEHDHRANEYIVVEEPQLKKEIVQESYLQTGTVLSQLPSGSESEYRDGKQYFTDGVHHFEVVVVNGKVAYKVINL